MGSDIQSTTNWDGLLSLVASAGLVAGLSLVFEPRWESNDDVGMSMVAHGYGLATYGSPNLIFSNVLWGQVVRTTPTINGVLGYSLATMAALFLAAWLILYSLVRLGAGYAIGILCVVLIFARPTLFPQFTINAGLMTVAAVIALRVYANRGTLHFLVGASALTFLGFLIRSQEFLLVSALALPLLPWRAIRDRRPLQVALILLSIAITWAWVMDRSAYGGSEWQRFNDLNPARAPFTDFGAADHLKRRPDITGRYGFSRNDLDLVHNWFFADAKITDAKSLKGMLGELGPLPMQPESIEKGILGLGSLASPVLVPLLVAALLISALLPKWAVAIAWISCLGAVFVLGVLGRPSTLRVYVPLLSLLLLAPLLFDQQLQARRWIAAAILFGACVWNLWLLWAEQAVSTVIMRQVGTDSEGLPAEPIVSWGHAFPFEFAFPVLTNNAAANRLRFYALGVFTLAPFSVAVAQERKGDGVIARLRKPEGLPIYASPKHIEMLGVYCRDRFEGRLHAALEYETPSILVQRVICKADE